jgi:hypothetical protein
MGQRRAQPPADAGRFLPRQQEEVNMKTLSIFAVAAIIAGLAGACSVRHETVERPAVATVAVPSSTVVYY